MDRCRKGGVELNTAFTYHDPMKDTTTGQLLAIVKDLEAAVLKSKVCNTSCGVCDICKQGYKSDRGDGDTPELPEPKGDKNLKPKKKGKKDSKKGEKKEGDGDKKEKLFGKGDVTSQFLRERGIIVKYEQENSVDNQVPQLMEVSGSETIRATTYTTNQRVPYMEDGSAASPISEVAKMPSVSQTGYDETSSSLHMKLNDGGGFTDNIDQWEEKLTELKKAHPGKVGIIEEIASLTEQVYARL